MITTMAVLILCAAAFTLIYISKPHTSVEPIETGPETTKESEPAETSETTISDVLPITPKETEKDLEPLVIDILSMERDPNPHIINTDVIYEGENDE